MNNNFKTRKFNFQNRNQNQSKHTTQITKDLNILYDNNFPPLQKNDSDIIYKPVTKLQTQWSKIVMLTPSVEVEIELKKKDTINEVFNKEIINKEIINKELVNEVSNKEIINKELINEEIINEVSNKDIINKELVNKESNKESIIERKKNKKNIKITKKNVIAIDAFGNEYIINKTEEKKE